MRPLQILLIASFLSATSFLPPDLQAEPFPGYTLYGPSNGRVTYLRDLNNNIVKQWNHARNGGYTYYLLESGHLLRTTNAPNIRINGGGAQGIVNKYDWNGNLVWEYTYSSATVQAHHDIEPLPNGNVLMIAWEVKTAAEAQAAGLSRNVALWPDHIIEVRQTGLYAGEIVWEWHAWDHLIQDYNQNRANYGVVGDHPELLDINVSGGGGGPQGGDWMHVNGISYNPELDQIVFSSHNLNEIWVIDHSTTTAQAASHQGGRWGRGGDFLYRWGKPANYRAQGAQVFYVVHCSVWIPAGLPGGGNLMAFNNRQGQGTSMIVELVPPRDERGVYLRNVNGAYGPANPVWTYTANGFYSNHLGGNQRLPNGNTLIAQSTSGRIFEVNNQGAVQWNFTPGGEVVRALRYPLDYPGVYGLNPVAAGVIVVNELLVVNSHTAADQDNEFDPWIEFYNNGNTARSLWGFYLSNDANNPTRWRFPNTASIPARNYLIVWLDGDSTQAGLHTNFEPAAQGGRIVFSAPDGTVLNNVQYNQQTENISWGRFPNGSGQFRAMTPSFGEANHEGIIGPNYRSLAINELLADNATIAGDQDGEYEHWLELFNNSQERIPLNGLFLTNDRENPTKWAFPDTAIAGREYLIIWLDEDLGQSGLHTNFQLSIDGGLVLLVAPNQDIIDSAAYERQSADISYGRYPDGASDMIFMTPSFAAPNNDRIIPPDYQIVLNELLAVNVTTAVDQNNEFDPWVELFNNSENSMPLTRVYLTDEPANPMKWAFPDITIPGRGYMIVWLDEDVGQSGLHADFQLSGAGGRLQLIASDRSVIDEVVYPAQTADISYGRYPNGSGEFIRMTPTFAAPNGDGINDLPPPNWNIPCEMKLTDIHPNPFNSTTTISFQLPAAAEVRIDVYNTLGQCIIVPVSGMFAAGRHKVDWNGTDMNGNSLCAGLYYCVLISRGNFDAQKIVLLR